MRVMKSWQVNLTINLWQKQFKERRNLDKYEREWSYCQPMHRKFAEEMPISPYVNDSQSTNDVKLLNTKITAIG